MLSSILVKRRRHLGLLSPIAALALLCSPHQAARPQSSVDAPRVGLIEIERLPIFPNNAEAGLPWFMRATNRLHAMTRETVIRRELLFREGDPIDTLRLRESEYLLRQRGLFEWAAIDHQVRDSMAVVRVRTQDLWTLGIILSYEKQAEISSLTFGMRDRNFLGSGNTLYWSQMLSTDQDAFIGMVELPRLAATRGSLSLQFSEQGEAATRSIGLGRLPETPLDEWGWGIGGHLTRGEKRFFQSGEEVGSSGFERQSAGVHLGRYPSGALQVGYGAGWVERRIDPHGEAKSLLEEAPPPPAFEKRRHGGPLAFACATSRRFVPAMNLERYGVVEDYPVGFMGHLTALPNRRWREDRDHAFLLQSTLAGALIPLPHLSIGIEAYGDLFLRSDRRAGDRLLRGAMTAMWQPSPRLLTIAQGFLLRGKERPATSVHYLGGASGLRGFTTREFEARDYLLATLEQRIWSGIEVAWVGIGANLFVDAGLPSPREGFRGVSWRGGLGGGLLLGLRKSSQKPIRVEIAWRTDREADPTVSIATSTVLRLIPKLAIPTPIFDPPR
ncbi:MAG: hypothetical protein FJY88_02265 [Candidatus Eisenbacteria bacterium]|nr:hypothetical protein [Candidatus Eisenbacteria bacterium]